MRPVTVSFVAISMLLNIGIAYAAGALPDGPYVIASGQATTDVAPDYAVITLTVEALAPTTSAASAQTDAKTAKIMDILKGAGLKDEDVRASGLKVNPSYDYVNDKKVFQGQDVTRDFKVTLHDLKKFSDLIQGLLDSDIDYLGDVEFGSSRRAEIERTTLEAALDDARRQADDLANHAGENVDRVYGLAPGQYSSFITQEFPYQSYYNNSALGKIEVTGTRIKRTDATAYIVPKSITFSASITVVYTVK